MLDLLAVVLVEVPILLRGPHLISGEELITVISACGECLKPTESVHLDSSDLDFSI